VRALEVVGVDEERQPAVAVGEVRKHRPAQKLLPERLPEALHLAQRLRMLRAALDVPDPLPAQLAFEVRLATPRGVLTPLVGQDLLRRPVRGDATCQRLHHQRRALMVRQRPRHDEARVVVHEGCQVQPLVASQQKREDVRLPHLIGGRAFEATRTMLPRRIGLPLLDETRLVQDPPHLRLAHPDRLEARQHVADPARAVLGMLLAHRHDGLLFGLRCRRPRLPAGRRRMLLRHQRVNASLLIRPHPRDDGGPTRTEGL
jgi:hypothetical protein